VLLAIGVVLAAMATASPVPAQTAKDKATQLVRAAVVLVDEGKLDGALELFEKAYRLDPAPVILGHMAKVHDRKGNLAKAREMYEQWVATETDPGRLSKARVRLEDILERIPGKLVVTATPAGAAVKVDGRSVAAGAAVELKRGGHDVEVTLAGHAPEKRTAEIRPGGETRLGVELKPLPGRLAVRGGPSGARVTVNGADGRTLPLDRPYVLPPGHHVVEVTAKGYEKMVRTVEVGPDATATVDADLVALLPPAVAVRARDPEPLRTEGVTKPAEVRSSPWPWVCIGTGAAALVVGGVMSGLAYRERSAVSGASREGDVVTGVTMTDAQGRVDTAGTYDKVSYAMYGIGGAAVVTGIILAVTLPKKAPDADSGSPALGASPVPGGMAVSAAWRF
jgi:hypothetical protein